VLATLVDRSGGTALPLPTALVERYGGPLRFPNARPYVFANFVSTIDGVASFDRPGEAQAARISHGHSADRFMLALLRAVADAVIVGAGTLRQEPDSIWTPESVFPQGALDFAALRRVMDAGARPLTVIASASGEVDLSAPALAEGEPVLIITTKNGAARLRDVPAHIEVRGLASTGAREIVREAVAASRGRLILTEGGPRLLGQFLRDDALDELFLTIAPRIAGRSPAERRLGIAEGHAFGADDALEERLVSVKSADDYLFLRFSRAR
jgi:riboflavin biosynthesis pyrimidine reductase